MFKDMDFKVPDSAKQNLMFDPAPPEYNVLNRDAGPLEDTDEIIADYQKDFFVKHMQQYFGM